MGAIRTRDDFMAVAKMKFGTKVKKQSEHGKALFFSAVFFVLVGVVSYLYLKPPQINAADGCPVDAEFIHHRNVMVVDTTSLMPKAKQADIERIIREFANLSKPIGQWLTEGKKADQTSIFLLSDTSPLDMKPIAKFCTQPPGFLVLSSSTASDVRKYIKAANKQISEALELLINGSNSSQSPIIETLTIITSSSSYWSPGSTLVLASDLMQNTTKCGYFDKMSSVGNYSTLPAACLQSVEQLKENLRSTSTYPEPTNVAICELPLLPTRTGKLQFWHSIFQDALGFDAPNTCDPTTILERSKEIRKLAQKSN
jgi:hypothetical protein